MKSIQEIADSVKAQLSVIASQEAGEGAGFDQTFSGVMLDEDDLVIRVGDSLEEGTNIFPLTALYHWLQGVSREVKGGLVLRVRADVTDDPAAL